MVRIRQSLIIYVAFMLALTVSSNGQDEPINEAPIADAGTSRYAGPDPVVLDGTSSYDPDNSGALSYTWRQIAGPSTIIIDANTATPTICSSITRDRQDNITPICTFIQTDEIQECEFELLVSDGKLTSLPDTVKVIIVPSYNGLSILQKENRPFNVNKPTVFYFGGGDCIYGESHWYSTISWYEKANVLSVSRYVPDPEYEQWRTYYHIGDLLIVYLSSVACDYNQPIQTIGWSTGGQPAIDAAIHMNQAYQDARYAVNRVTQLDADCRYRDGKELYYEITELYLASSVDGEQCWLDHYYGPNVGTEVVPNMLLGCLGLGHEDVQYWYTNSLTNPDTNLFNAGVIGGAYWSVIGPGRNLQLASFSDEYFYFAWSGDVNNGRMLHYDEAKYPARLPEPVTLIGPLDGEYVDVNGVVLSCEVSENVIGYQLLFGSEPYRVMDYMIVSDTPEPPSEVITTFPFEQTFWTVRVYDEYGSTIYADPICIYPENVVDSNETLVVEDEDDMNDG